MNIVASVHLYPPEHNCGAEWMLHFMLKDLQSKGHNVRVLLHDANKYKIRDNYVFDGIDVFPPNPNVIENLMMWSHAVLLIWTIQDGQFMQQRCIKSLFFI
jgi:glycosyltransferase involved in cell wall biosynthesis